MSMLTIRGPLLPTVLTFAVVSGLAGAQGRLFLGGSNTVADLSDTRLHVAVEDRVATTEIVQRFFNPGLSPVEGELLVPLPPGAAVSRFQLTAGGKEMAGSLLQGRQARHIYEGIVAKRRDPALLEYLDWGLYRAKVFPIPPRGEVALTLTYECVVGRQGDAWLLSHPLTRPDRGYPLPVEADLKTSAPLRSIFSPSHALDVNRIDAHRARVRHAGTTAPGVGRFDLYFTTDRKSIGISVLTHRTPGEPGYFLALLSPDIECDPKTIDPKDFVLILDVSGSMKGAKIEQARAAAAFCLKRLDPRDRFNVIAFSFESRSFRPALVQATAENVKAGLGFVNGLEATGGTNLHDALVGGARLQKAEDRVGITIFLTDGQPTIGVTDENAILEAVRAARPARNRIFVFGVGDGVNTRLLDRVAEENRGDRTYVDESESIETKVCDLYGKVRHPVLADLKLSVDGLVISDTYPRRVPDLFKGTQRLVLGRYDNAGEHTVRLEGKKGKEGVTFAYDAEFPEVNPANAFLPRLWAMRKVGYVLDQIRLHGKNPELVDAVVALGKRHGIVTPYTAFLVVEDEADLAGVHTAMQNLTAQEAELRQHGNALLARQTGRGATGVSRATNRMRAFNGPSGSVPPNMQPPGSPQPPAGPVTTPTPSPTPSPTPTPTPTPSGASAAGARSAVTRGSGSLDPSHDASESAAFFFGRKTKSVAREARRSSPTPRTGPPQYRTIGGHTFLKLKGVWVDTRYDLKTMEKTLTRVESFSAAYFDLLKKHPELKKLLAVGPRLIVVIAGKAYYVAPAPKKPAPKAEKQSPKAEKSAPVK